MSSILSAILSIISFECSDEKNLNFNYGSISSLTCSLSLNENKNEIIMNFLCRNMIAYVFYYPCCYYSRFMN